MALSRGVRPAVWWRVALMSGPPRGQLREPGGRRDPVRDLLFCQRAFANWHKVRGELAVYFQCFEFPVSIELSQASR